MSPTTSRKKQVENICMDFNPVLRVCNSTHLACEHPNCDSYPSGHRKHQMQQIAANCSTGTKPQEKRDFVREICEELDKMGVCYEIDGVIHNEPDGTAPKWF